MDSISLPLTHTHTHTHTQTSVFSILCLNTSNAHLKGKLTYSHMKTMIKKKFTIKQHKGCSSDIPDSIPGSYSGGRWLCHDCFSVSSSAFVSCSSWYSCLLLSCSAFTCTTRLSTSAFDAGVLAWLHVPPESELSALQQGDGALSRAAGDLTTDGSSILSFWTCYSYIIQYTKMADTTLKWDSSQLSIQPIIEA
jgi:hypothetical protein